MLSYLKKIKIEGFKNYIIIDREGSRRYIISLIKIYKS